MSSTKKIIVIAILCAAVCGLAILAFRGIDQVFFHPWAKAAGFDWLTRFSSIWFVVGAFVLLPGRYTAIPMPIEIRGTADINAPPDAVWDVVEPRPRDDYWGAAMSHTTGVEGDPERLNFHFSKMVEGDADVPIEAVIEAVVPEEYFSLTYLNARAFPGMGGDLVRSEYFLEPHEDGTRITQIEYLARLRLSTIPLLLFLNPSRDALMRLKAIVEETKDESWMGQMAEKLPSYDS